MSKTVTKDDPRIDKVTSASLTDAMGRRYPHKAHVLDLVSPTDEPLFGRAITIRYLPLRDDLANQKRYTFGRLFYEAVGGEKPQGEGCVLVLSSSGNPEVSLGGGTKLSRLQNHKLAGIVADGRLRDFARLEEYDFATWCTEETPRAGDDELMPFEANVPVTLRDVTVFPGDFVFVDNGGAVIIPPRDIEWVLDQAVAIEEEDERFLDEIRNEDPAEVLRKGSGEH